MSLWIPRTATAPGERVLFTALANTFQGLRSIGGRVTVTDRRLLFTPNGLDSRTGGRRVAVERREIGRVWVEDPGWSAMRQRGMAAAVRPQVRVEHLRGTTFITVSKPEVLVAALEAAPR